ncbi:hypothetical protein [Streptomyces sp. NPDC088739]|uniref:hypothetical protein n=1 Tax=Streptomyces sp. NPDC088739 TaxID=3365882 RepID=UPI003817FF12
MTITLVRPLDLDPELIAAVLAASVDTLDAAVDCEGCGAVALDEDTARDRLGWVFDEDRDVLLCEGCAAFDAAPSAYWR